MNNMSATIATSTKKRKMTADLAAEAKRVKTVPAAKQPAAKQPAPADDLNRGQPALIDLTKEKEEGDEEGKGSEAAEFVAIRKVTTKVDAQPADAKVDAKPAEQGPTFVERHSIASSCPNKEKQVPHLAGVMVEPIAEAKGSAEVEDWEQIGREREALERQCLQIREALEALEKQLHKDIVALPKKDFNALNDRILEKREEYEQAISALTAKAEAEAQAAAAAEASE